MSSTFSSLSDEYQQKASLQQDASIKLFELLALGKGENVLDLGCGPGHLTRKIRDWTTGVVFGVDPSETMIAKARRNCQKLAVTFLTAQAETFETTQTFDAIFCNSAFQWFNDPAKALANCHRVLRPGGRIGIQSPAGVAYCPNFLTAADALANDPRTRAVFAHFQAPWFFLESAAEYARLFEASGFVVNHSQIETITESFFPDKVMMMFDSGAAAAYLNPVYYKTHVPASFDETARAVIKASFQAQAQPTGKVPVTFHRIYLVAEKKA
jgi:trans-aconitate methyltransferase